MDGLETVEIRLSQTLENKDFRHDSNFWTTIIHKNPTLEYDKIGNRLVKSQYGISISMNEDGVGIPIYRMNEIHNMLCNSNVDKCAELSFDELETFKLNNRDVLFNRTNSFEWVGRTGIYYQNSTQLFVFASYLVRFVPDETVLPEYLTAFLSCKFGVMAIKARARESINQTNVNPEEVKEIEIPILSGGLQNEIANCFLKANDYILKSESIYVEAEQILLSYFKFDSTMENLTGTAIKTFKDSFATSSRLDSEYYQPKYEEIENHLGATETVSSLCNVYNVNYTPDNYDDYKYIELSNIGTSGEISGVDTIIGSELPTRARRLVRKGQVIVSSIEGSLNSCALIDEEYDNALCSTGFYVVDSDTLNSETLLTLFKSVPIQALLKKRCSGTILTAINKDEFLSMPLPFIEVNTQEEIKEKIQESFTLRKKSAELLELAKTAVEVTIEQGEDVAIKYLNEKGVEV